MSFPVNLYLLALASGFAGALLSLPLWRRACLRAGWIDEPAGRKDHAAPVPLAGGLSVMTGLLAPLAAAALALAWGGRMPAGPVAGISGEALRLLDYGFGARGGQLAVLLLGALGMLVLGWLDDRHELKPLPKFAGQLAIALLTAAAGVRITLFVPSVAFSYLVTVLWILTLTNALNFLDNMNGLCAGIGAIAAAFFALAAARQGQYLVGALACLGCGALLGFLPWNYPRAAAFLGDSGSHVVGYLLAVLAILPHFYSAQHPRGPAVLSPLLVLAVPLADLASVVWIRARAGRPFYLGDQNHFSHRLVRAGLRRPQAVALLWAAGILAGLLSLAL